MVTEQPDKECVEKGNEGYKTSTERVTENIMRLWAMFRRSTYSFLLASTRLCLYIFCRSPQTLSHVSTTVGLKKCEPFSWIISSPIAALLVLNWSPSCTVQGPAISLFFTIVGKNKPLHFGLPTHPPKSPGMHMLCRRLWSVTKSNKPISAHSWISAVRVSLSPPLRIFV